MSGAIPAYSEFSVDFPADYWKKELQNHEVFLIKKGKEVVGNFSYQHKSPDHIYISGLVVSPEYQGKGIARAVLELFLSQHLEAKRIDLVI